MDLISKRTRNHFRDICCDFAVVRQIEQAFQNEDFEEIPMPGPGAEFWKDGRRRGTFSLYADGIDWTDPEQVRRVVPVLEEILGWLTPEYGDAARAKVTHSLERDGYSVTESGRIVATRSGPLSDLPLEHLSDPAALLGHLTRLEGAAESDPPLAISQSKALIEATTKLVLTDLGEPYSETEELPGLVKAAQKALALHPETLAPDAKGVEVSKRILGNLAGVAVGLAAAPQPLRDRPRTGPGCRAPGPTAHASGDRMRRDLLPDAARDPRCSADRPRARRLSLPIPDRRIPRLSYFGLARRWRGYGWVGGGVPAWLCG